MAHPAQLPLDLLLRDCQFRATRRSGPGGQHRNKVETAVVVEHIPTQLRAEASERRSQLRNREVAIQRLRIHLALQVRTPPESLSDHSLPSPLWKSRLAGKQIVVSESHEDFPALLAEALDVLAYHDFDFSLSSDQLQVTKSQLVKFLRLQSAALLTVNTHRRERGLPVLR